MVIRAVGANVAVNAAQAHQFVAGILCIISFFLLFLFYFFFSLSYTFYTDTHTYIVFFSSVLLLLSAPTFLLWWIAIAFSLVKSPASLTHTCLAVLHWHRASSASTSSVALYSYSNSIQASSGIQAALKCLLLLMSYRHFLHSISCLKRIFRE